jgi:hypothetical protein
MKDIAKVVGEILPEKIEVVEETISDIYPTEFF